MSTDTERDALDRRIINALQEDGRASVLDVAEMADAPVTTVQKRLQRLRDAGVITGYEPRIEYSTLDYELTAIFKLDLDLHSDVERLITLLQAEEHVMSVYEVTGTFDVLAIGKYTDTQSMNEQIKTLLTHAAVKAADTSVVLNTIRENEPLEIVQNSENVGKDSED